MRNYIILLLFIFAACETPQSTQNYSENKITLPIKGSSVFYEQVINIDSATKTQLYQRAKFWFVNEFKDSKFVLETDNADIGQLTGKGSMPSPYSPLLSTGSIINFTVNVNIKDNKYRYQFYNFIMHPFFSNGMGNDVPFINFYKVYINGDGVLYTILDSKQSRRQRAYDIISTFNSQMNGMTLSLRNAMKSNYINDF